MATVVQVRPADERADLLAPRDDVLVLERLEDDGTFCCAEGPFHRYRRQVRDLDDGRVEVTVDFSIRPAFWGLLFVPGMKRRLPRPSSGRPWWAPPHRLDRRGAEVFGLLCSAGVVGGYLGTVITQTATFAADEFGASRTAQSNLLSAVRASLPIFLVLSALADRLGRRRILTLSAGLGCVFTATGALSPNLVGLGISQSVARGFATALILVIGVVSAEEMPAGSRAWAFSLLAMCQALGSGMCLWFLPLADIGGEGSASWRLLYVLPLLFLPLVVTVQRHLPESRRFEVDHVQAPIAGHGRRFWMLAATVLLLAVFATPASQLGNDFLKEVRGFSGARITIFTLCTATPAAIGIVIGGRLADVRGRRVVGAVGVGVGTVLSVIAFSSTGWSLWAWTIIQNVIAATVVPALGVYRSELFPTSLRGKAAGALDIFSVIGSVAGLQIVGRMVDGGSSYGTAFATIAIAPLLVVLIVLFAYPETAMRSLEELNPEDSGTVLAREDP